MLCVLCAPCGLALLYWYKGKKTTTQKLEGKACEASLNGLQGYKRVSQKRKIEWAAWCEPCRRVLTADLLLIMQLCPGLDLAAPTLFPSPGLWMNQHKHKMLPLLSTKYSSGPRRKPSISFRFHSSASLPWHKAAYSLNLVLPAVSILVAHVIQPLQIRLRKWQASWFYLSPGK